ncbi:Holliday junction resolvase RuvX [Verrucomicrobia bacterium]|jgi:putative holliday junction resolvase|nr:Holliday junction resolvase RuvX [Verrucomicrobiota bacterium]MDA7867075.1 Holliday junction resolvase RuvX [Verrucomicrobiota bacterium]
MRVLGLDHGTERIGVALSDDLGMIAQPLEFIPNHPTPGIWKRLKELLQDFPYELIVIGMPRNMDGSYGPASEKVNQFIEQLKLEIDTPIKTWDERLSSAQANRVLLQANVSRKKRKGKVDKMAAAIILQSYLDSVQM